MRHRLTGVTWFVPCSVPVVLAAAFTALAPLALGHCGGDGSNVVLDGGNHSGSTTQPMGDDGAPGDDATVPGSGSGSGSGGEGMDGSQTLPGLDGSVEETGTSTPPPVPVPDGGAASDPGAVTCNGAPCDVSTGNFCCVETADGGSTETCKPPNSACGGLSLKCNEASDCKDGALCCQGIVGIAQQASTSCQMTCPWPSTFQACRTDGECGAGSDAAASKRCLPQLCTNTVPMRTLSIEGCAVPPQIGNQDGTLQYCAVVQ